MAAAEMDETLMAMQLQAAEVARLIQESADFEMAFQMQLDEALTASSSGSSSASTSSSRDSKGKSIDLEMDDTEDSGVEVVDDDRQLAVSQQKDEMEKLNQEMQDEVEAFKEQARLTESLAITQHDAKFARFLSSLPEQAWNRDGEHLTDPFTYTPVESNLAAKMKNVKGIDVSSTGPLVLCQSNMWEPALAAASFFDAKNFNNQSYLGTMKEGFLVARSGQAEDGCSGSGEGEHSSICEICMEAMMNDHNSFVISDKCRHCFCTDCLQKHAETAVKSGKAYVTCPQYHCEELLSSEMCQRFLSSMSLLILTQRQIEDAFPESERLYCPYRDCSVLQLKPEVPTQPSGSSKPHKAIVGGVECLACNRQFCMECQVPWHGHLTCEEFQNLPIGDRSIEDLSLLGLAKTKKWQRCKVCGAMVELKQGCCHITCRCGRQFCYTCGAKWTHGHLC